MDWRYESHCFVVLRRKAVGNCEEFVRENWELARGCGECFLWELFDKVRDSTIWDMVLTRTTILDQKNS